MKFSGFLFYKLNLPFRLIQHSGGYKLISYFLVSHLIRKLTRAFHLLSSFALSRLGSYFFLNEEVSKKSSRI